VRKLRRSLPARPDLPTRAHRACAGTDSGCPDRRPGRRAC
jgi:hypothetical protein